MYKKTTARLAVLAVASLGASVPLTATVSAMTEKHHPGERCNPKKRPPHGFKCVRRNGKNILVRKR